MMNMRGITQSKSHSTMMLFKTVIIALMASSLFLSVDAIRCHQCNSHLEEDCTNLRLNTPRAPVDTQYLRECDGEHSAEAFCRKIVTKIEVSGEQRIIRSCGWIRGSEHAANLTCLQADNEGYKQLLCSCFHDGCNAAPANLFMRNGGHTLISLLVIAIFMMSMWRRLC